MPDDMIIDVKKYLRLLLGKWIWIAGAGVAGGLILLVAAFLAPDSYEASAVFTITGPKYQLEIAPDFQTSGTTRPPVKAFIDMAVSDEMVAGVLAEWTLRDPQSAGDVTLTQLKKAMKARSGSDPSILILTAARETPEQALWIMGIWEDLFLRRMQEVFGRANPGDLAYLERQAADAEARREQAAAALVTFQSTNPEAVLNAELESAHMALADLQTRLRNIGNLQKRIRVQQDILAGKDAGAAAVLNDRLATLLIQLDATAYLTSRPGATLGTGNQNAGQGAGVEYPGSGNAIQWQLAQDALEPLTVGALRERLAAIDSALQNQSGVLLPEIGAQASAILAKQAALQRAVTDHLRLQADLDSSADIFLSVSRKLAETRILSDSDQMDVRLVSGAVEATDESSSKLVYPLAGAGAGMMLAILVILILDWWRAPQKDTQSVDETRHGNGKARAKTS